MADPKLKPEPNVIGKDGMNPRRRVLNRNSRLRSILNSWIAHWRELNDYILPRRLSYLMSDKNDGSKKNGKIVNGDATRYARILAAGKQANETSPVRPWFRIDPPEHLKTNQRCASWAAKAEKAMYAAFSGSNLYACLHELWFLQGVFGTAVVYIEEDEQDDVIGYVFPLGQFALASSNHRRADTIYRDFTTMTVEEVVTEFGLDNVSPTTKLNYIQGEWDKQVAIIHVIQPNVNRDTGKIDNTNMPFRSEWWEKEASDDWDKPLRISGFEEQPFMVARWNVTGDDIYGSDCPGMDALGDVKGLQHTAVNRAEAFDKLVTPPMKAPTSAKTTRVSMLPHDATYVDETQGGTKLEPMIEVRPETITVCDNTMASDSRRLASTFYADLFQMLLMDDSQQPRTAYDISKRVEERMLQLGPVVELDTNDVLDPMLKRVFRILARRGKIEPPPAELVGQKMQITYVSNMAQAQKLLGSAAREKFLSLVGSVSAINKDVLDLPQYDVILRSYADMLGLKPEEINPEDVVQAMRQARQQQQQMAQTIQAAQGAAQAAEAASKADTSGDNILTRLLSGTGMGGPAAYGG